MASEVLDVERVEAVAALEGVDLAVATHEQDHTLEEEVPQAFDSMLSDSDYDMFCDDIVLPPSMAHDDAGSSHSFAHYHTCQSLSLVHSLHNYLFPNLTWLVSLNIATY